MGFLGWVWETGNRLVSSKAPPGSGHNTNAACDPDPQRQEWRDGCIMGSVLLVVSRIPVGRGVCVPVHVKAMVLIAQ